jgi:hypothetical protein
MAALFVRLINDTGPQRSAANTTDNKPDDGWGGVPPPRVAVGNQSHGPSLIDLS